MTLEMTIKPQKRKLQLLGHIIYPASHNVSIRIPIALAHSGGRVSSLTTINH